MCRDKLHVWQAAKNTAATRDTLVELFEKIESFFKRIKTYTEATPTPDLIEALAMIMAEVLSILAIATKGVKKKWWSRSIFCDKLLSLKLDQIYFLRSWRE
jgi:hypothetical protein